MHSACTSSSNRSPSFAASKTECIPTGNTIRRSQNTSDPEYYRNLLSVSDSDETFSVDQPEYVYVRRLTRRFNKNMDEVMLIIDDENCTNDEGDDDSGIFIDAYRQPAKTPATRKNPVRKIRNKGTYLQEEHILEDDFHFLDQMEQENLIACRSKRSKPKSITSNELYKTWPINSCEIPRYDPVTDQIIPIDVPKYIKVPKMKDELKPKPKFSGRQRRPKLKQKAVPEMVAVGTLKDVVSETLEMVKNFVKTSDDDKDNLEYLEILKNQETLMALVNAASETIET